MRNKSDLGTTQGWCCGVIDGDIWDTELGGEASDKHWLVICLPAARMVDALLRPRQRRKYVIELRRLGLAESLALFAAAGGPVQSA